MEKVSVNIGYRIFEIACVVLVYILSARLGQIFAIPPGNITPVWFPSGIMFSWVLIRGYYIWPGIFLGALLGNAWAYVEVNSFSGVSSTLFSGLMNGTGDVLCSAGAVFFIK